MKTTHPIDYNDLYPICPGCSELLERDIHHIRPLCRTTEQIKARVPVDTADEVPPTPPLYGLGDAQFERKQVISEEAFKHFTPMAESICKHVVLMIRISAPSSARK